MASTAGLSRREDAPGPVDMAPSNPEIAIVIGAVAREEFVEAAVGSVLAQTLPRDRYEIVVTEDFHSARLEGYLRTNGVREVFDPDRSQGRVVRAARATRAPLVAYLDDDDLFEPERLEEVLATFRRHPEVSFYRNRVSVVDEAGTLTDPAGWDDLYRAPSLDRTGPILVGANEKRARWTEVLASSPEFNLSSMVVRREVVDGVRGARLERMGARIDLGHFVEAYLAPGAVYLDDRRLTRYRLHRTNSSRIRARPGQRLPRGWEELGRLQQGASEQRQTDLARWIRRQRITAGLGFHVDRLTRAVYGGAPIPEVSKYAREYLRFLCTYPTALRSTWSWRPFAYSTAQVAAPPLARTPGVGFALRRDILGHYPRGSWTELVGPSRPD